MQHNEDDFREDFDNEEEKPLSLRDLLGEDDYEELQLKSVVDKADKGHYMQPFYNWLKQVNPDYNWDWKAQRFIIEKLQMLSDGEIKRLMISLPP